MEISYLFEVPLSVVFIMSPCLENASLQTPASPATILQTLESANPRVTPFLTFEHNIKEVLSCINKNPLPFSCLYVAFCLLRINFLEIKQNTLLTFHEMNSHIGRIFTRTPNLLVLRIMPQATHATCVASLATDIFYAASNIFNNRDASIWRDNVIPHGPTVRLSHKSKQPDASWAPRRTRDPTVVFEVCSPETFSQLEDDIPHWFAKGTSTRFALLASISNSAHPLTISVQCYACNDFPRTFRVRDADAQPVKVFEALWNGDWTSGNLQPLTIPATSFLPVNIQFPPVAGLEIPPVTLARRGWKVCIGRWLKQPRLPQKTIRRLKAGLRCIFLVEENANRRDGERM
ncbi:hypothetical protein B0H19DRAFT_303681 [Mycena capillaripes]|nr:hypothetical protein B0H19DRAFT_303681 [Mycena capillaripes]